MADVRSVEDLSSSLKEAGVGSLVDFTVWRSFEQTPLKLSVQLKGAQNPALAISHHAIAAPAGTKSRVPVRHSPPRSRPYRAPSM